MKPLSDVWPALPHFGRKEGDKTVEKTKYAKRRAMNMLTSCHLRLRAAAPFTGDFLLRRRVGGSDTPVRDASEQKRAKALGRLGSPASSLLTRFPILHWRARGPYGGAWEEKLPKDILGPFVLDSNAQEICKKLVISQLIQEPLSRTWPKKSNIL